jgi:hypothetical protein
LEITISDVNIYLAENNASSDGQVNKLDNFEIHEQKIEPNLTK